MHQHLEIYHVPEKMGSRFVGLQRCASVWLCPVCAAHITEYRRKELARAIEVAGSLGLSVYLQTLTFAHKSWDSLSSMLESFNAARRSLTVGRSGTLMLRQQFGYVGKVSALEVTHGTNGWHPHAHELVFLPSEASAQQYDQAMRARWQVVASRHGLQMNERGYKLDATNGAVADYVAKYGHSPASGTPWGVDAEMTKSHVKRSKSAGGETPFSLLGWSSEVDQAARLFVEYARNFKGKHQLQYSQGLRELLNLDDKSDAEIVEGSDSEGLLLALLDWQQWRRILAQDARAEVVAAANLGDPVHFAGVLASLGIS